MAKQYKCKIISLISLFKKKKIVFCYFSKHVLSLDLCEVSEQPQGLGVDASRQGWKPLPGLSSG